MARRKLSEEEANRLKGELSPFSLPSPSPHIVLFAKKGGVTYSLYSNLTLLTQGEGEIKDGRPRTCPRFKPEIGSDEVGTGDYFGPIVVTAAFVRSEWYLAENGGTVAIYRGIKLSYVGGAVLALIAIALMLINRRIIIRSEKEAKQAAK